MGGGGANDAKGETTAENPDKAPDTPGHEGDASEDYFWDNLWDLVFGTGDDTADTTSTDDEKSGGGFLGLGHHDWSRDDDARPASDPEWTGTTVVEGDSRFTAFLKGILKDHQEHGSPMAFDGVSVTLDRQNTLLDKRPDLPPTTPEQAAGTQRDLFAGAAAWWATVMSFGLPELPAFGGAVGFADDAVASAYRGMNKGGGHAMRHLIDEGLIPNSGTLAARAQQFQDLTSPILRSPSAAFDWNVGGTAARAFAGEAGGKSVVVFVAKEGPYQGTVISAVVPDAAQAAQWGL